MSTEAKSGKLPWMKFYPGDWRKDPGVQSLDYETKGIWFEIICLMHESDHRGRLMLNNQPMPEEALARLLGLDQAKVKQTLSKLLAYGVAELEQTTGIVYCRRMVREDELHEKRAEAGEKGGKARAGAVCLSKTPSQGQAKPKQNPDMSEVRSQKSEVRDIDTEQQGAVAPAAGAASPPESPELPLTTEPAKPKRQPATRFTPPTMEELGAYAAEIGMAPARAANFMDYQTAKGWKVGTAPMKCWKAALRTWNARPDFNASAGNGAPRLDKDGQLPMAPPGVAPGPGQRWHRNGKLPQDQIMTPEERAAQPHHLPPQPGEPKRVTEDRLHNQSMWRRAMRQCEGLKEDVANERLYPWMKTWGEMTPEEKAEK